MISPGYLLALLALPIYWWLRRRETQPRRRPVSSLLLWAAVPAGREDRARAWERRTDWIVALELAGMAFVVMALAGPAWRSGDAGARPWVVYVDRSASLAARDAGGERRWDRVRAALGEWIGSRPAGERFHLLTGAGERLGPVGPREALTFLARTEPRAREERRADGVAAAWTLARAVGGRGPVVATDRTPEPDENAPGWIARGEPAENAGLVALAAERREDGNGGRLEVLVRILNAGRSARDAVLRAPGAPNVPLRLEAGGEVERILVFPWPAAAAALAPGGCLEIGLTSGDALAADDTVRLALPPPADPVWRVGPDNRELDRALDAVFPGRVRRLDRVEDLPADARGIFFFSRAVPERAPAGPAVFLNPDRGLPGVFARDDEGFEIRARRLSGAGHAWVRHANLDVARILRARRIRFSPGVAAETLLEADGGAPLIAPVGGRPHPLLVIAFDTAWRGETGDSDWAQLPGFPVFFAQLAREWDTSHGEARDGVAWFRPGDSLPHPRGERSSDGAPAHAPRAAEAGCFPMAAPGAPPWTIAVNLVSREETLDGAHGADLTRWPEADAGADLAPPRERWRLPLGLGMIAVAAAAALETARRRPRTPPPTP